MPIGVYPHNSPSKETRKKMSETNKKIKHNGHFKKGSIPWNKNLKGIHLHSETEWKKGQTPIGSKVFKKGQFENEKHPLWKGEDASYSAKHHWIKRKLGKPNRCEFCGKIKGRFEWANKSRKYKRELNDWISLCYSCHDLFDEARRKEWETRRK